MTTLEKYRAAVAESHRLEWQAHEFTRLARELRSRAEKEAGLIFCDGEPGFACWSHPDAIGWFMTAEAALEAMEKS